MSSQSKQTLGPLGHWGWDCKGTPLCLLPAKDDPVPGYYQPFYGTGLGVGVGWCGMGVGGVGVGVGICNGVVGEDMDTTSVLTTMH